MNNDMLDEEGNRRMDAYSDGGEAIAWEWRTRMDCLNGPTINKTLQKRGNGLVLKSMTRSSMELYIRTEKDPAGEFVELLYADRFDFNDVDFSRFSFNCSDTQCMVFKKKIKKFKFIQLVLKGKALREGAGVYAAALYYTVNDYAKKKR